jgi:hypothetical protein
MRTSLRAILFLFLLIFFSSCGDKCKEMLNSICEVRPNRALCERMTYKVKKSKMSQELCGAVDEAYWDLLDERSSE